MSLSCQAPSKPRSLAPVDSFATLSSGAQRQLVGVYPDVLSSIFNANHWAVQVGSDPITNVSRTVPTSRTIVNQKRHTLYFSSGDQALYATATSYLEAVENELLMSWSNNTNADQNYSQEYSIGFTSTTSIEISASISLAPSFEGVSVGSVDTGFTVFESQETSEIKTHTTNVTVPAHSDLYFYQRKYTFNTDVYFTLDAWNDLWIAGSQGAYHIQRANVKSTIYTRDYVTRDSALTGTQSLTFESQQGWGWYGSYVRKFENLTGRAKDKLRSIGIDGSQQDWNESQLLRLLYKYAKYGIEEMIFSYVICTRKLNEGTDRKMDNKSSLIKDSARNSRILVKLLTLSQIKLERSGKIAS